MFVGLLQRIKKNPDLRRFYQYNWVRRVAPIQQLITKLPRSNKTWRMLMPVAESALNLSFLVLYATISQ
jgi:hypothetical protein